MTEGITDAPSNDILYGRKNKEWIKVPDTPTKLPNPNALTFTGAIQAIYDGSAPITVNIPTGGGGSGLDWDSAHNFSQNGYQKFNNGLMIQWGYVGGSATASYRVTMPMSFYNTTYNVFATVNKPSSDNSIYSASPLATSKTVSAFYINRNYASGGSTGLSQESWQWFAVGRWK